MRFEKQAKESNARDIMYLQNPGKKQFRCENIMVPENKRNVLDVTSNGLHYANV